MPKLFGLPRVPGLPGPRPFPVLGHLPRVLQYLGDPIRVLTELREHGDVVAVSRESAALVCAFGPERNREVLSNPAGFRNDEDLFSGPPGSSLDRLRQAVVVINGDRHRRHRRLMAPAFGKSALAGYATPVVEIAEALVADWPRGEVANLDALLQDIALSVAIRTLFGIDERNGTSDLGPLAERWVEALGAPLTLIVRANLPGLPYRRALRLGNELLGRLEELVAIKRAGDDDDTDALARLLRAREDDGSGFTDDELISEVVTLFIAGHETTAKTLTWTMFLLERHPAVLADVLDELDATLGDRSVTVDDIEQLPLLDRVVKESMRLLSSVPTVFLRVPCEDLPLGRFTLPKGANVIVSPFATHRDPELYPDPLAFRPQRWERIKPSIYEYLPFGAGPRACLGAGFAHQSLRLILATVLRRVRVSIPTGTRVDRLVRTNILRPRHGLPARIDAPHRRRLTPELITGDLGEIVALA